MKQIFDHANVVIPVIIAANVKGRLQVEAERLWGTPPDLTPGEAVAVAHPGGAAIYVASWTAGAEPADFPAFAEHVVRCTRACIGAARKDRLATVAMPVLAEAPSDLLLPIMDWAVCQSEQEAVATGAHAQEVVFGRMA